jgi:hypothetical protein
LKRCHFAKNIVFCQPGLILPDFASFEVDRKIVNYFSYFKKNQKETNIAENSKKNLVEYPINIVGKITSEIGVPLLCWTNQIHNWPFELDIKEWLVY